MPAIEKYVLLQEIRDIPAAQDPAKVKVGLENWFERDALGERLCEDVSADPTGRALLECLFGNSPFLTFCLFNDLTFSKFLILNGLEAGLEKLYDDLRAGSTPACSQDEIMSALRLAKSRLALTTAIADIGNAWALARVTEELSKFAATAVDICCNHLLLSAATKGELVLTNKDRPVEQSGLIVLGMGKLGAFELNYSSDIDLIILFDPEKITYTGRKYVNDSFVKLARNLVKMMQERTKDGYVFRTDLRLRPDPGATPIALSVQAAMFYYESTGQNWERAAMIKARPIAGDIAAGNDFIDFLKPFIWRKHLDFAAIADIQSIKRQIHAHKGFAEITLAGHNIKIGRGGIREIEFFCQTQQLIEGGKNPPLRIAGTLATLARLTELERLSPEAEGQLSDAYIFLRNLEHRLQMIHDEQTQTLPSDPKDLDALGGFLGYADPAEFRAKLRTVLEVVKQHYDALFQFEEQPDRKAGRLVFTGIEDDPDTLASLDGLGFKDCASISQKIREWHYGRYRATRTERAQQILTKLMPVILEELARTIDPDSAFRRFDSFLQKLPAGVQLFSLFAAHPSLLKLVARIMGMAPELAGRLARNPLLLDAVISTDFFAPLSDKKAMQTSLNLILATAVDFQDVLEITRQWANEIKFRVGVHILDNLDHGSGLGPTVAAGIPLTHIAEVLLDSLLPSVETEFMRTHGIIPSARFSVIAAGKLGSREMSPLSDLDLIFVYDIGDETEMSNGKKPIPAGLYFTRLSQRLINGLSALTGNGVLYEVDMRLRPHGKSGPIALNFDGFTKYYQNEAWIWEHMALSRARHIAGSDSLGTQIDHFIDHDLQVTRPEQDIRDAILHMRERIAREHAVTSPWAIKHISGGLMDLEFIVQGQRLIHGPDHKSVLKSGTIETLEALGKLELIPSKDAKRLIMAAILLRNMQGLIRLSLGVKGINARKPRALKNALAEAGKTESYEELKTLLIETQAFVRQMFEKHVGTRKNSG